MLLKEIDWSYRSVGAKVWMMDLGKSFEKLCRNACGTYIEFGTRAAINLNPFTFITDIPEDIDMLRPAISKMASSVPLLEVQGKAISVMVIKLFKQYGPDLTITALREAFRSGTIEAEGI
uniref:hypothetical protein n=1 Tax=Enterococcus faecium TaxID=1352 RepID=UPI001C0F3B2E